MYFDIEQAASPEKRFGAEEEDDDGDDRNLALAPTSALSRASAFLLGYFGSLFPKSSPHGLGKMGNCLFLPGSRRRFLDIPARRVSWLYAGPRVST